jgi:hypothetical protein
MKIENDWGTVFWGQKNFGGQHFLWVKNFQGSKFVAGPSDWGGQNFLVSTFLRAQHFSGFNILGGSSFLGGQNL